ncbi:MAG: FHA domain-containing protein [Oscillibacter sp.]|nr:FHA domain-containing protein [Oscillibacter sp.]
MNRKQTLRAALVRLLRAIPAPLALILLLTPAARAASEPRILQWSLNPDDYALTVYVRRDDADVTGISLGGEAIPAAAIASDPGETHTLTCVLLDDSADMPPDARRRVPEFLSALFEAKAPNETFRFRTLSGSLSAEPQGAAAFADLLRRLDALTYGGLAPEAAGEILAPDAAHGGAGFVRIVLISAGGGISPERLLFETALSNIPVYVIGCADARALSEPYALSVRTFARYWDMDKVAASDAANILRWEEIPVRASLTVPEAFRTGGAQEIEAAFSDGSAVRAALTIPAQETGATAPQETDATAPSAQEQEEDETAPSTQEQEEGATSLPPQAEATGAALADFIPTILTLAVLGAGAAAVLFLRRGKPRSADDDSPSPGGYPSTPSDNPAAFPAASGNAGLAPDSGALPTLFLQDLNRPERSFEAFLDKPVTVGRAPGNNIVLDYDPTVSRRHCEIFLRGNRLWVRDLQSGIGTYVGGERAEDEAEIFPGAPLRLGYAEFKIEAR